MMALSTRRPRVSAAFVAQKPKPDRAVGVVVPPRIQPKLSMNHPLAPLPPRFGRFRPGFVGVALAFVSAGGCPLLCGQPARPPQPATEEELVELSPFTVQATSDRS